MNVDFNDPAVFLAETISDAVAVGNFDGDNNADLAVVNRFITDSTVSILLGDGNGDFTVAGSFATGNNSSVCGSRRL